MLELSLKVQESLILTGTPKTRSAHLPNVDGREAALEAIGGTTTNVGKRHSAYTPFGTYHKHVCNNTDDMQ
jgi:hypothetical protein